VSFLSKSKGYKVGTELSAKEKERPDKYDYKDLKSFIYYIQIGGPVVDISPKRPGKRLRQPFLLRWRLAQGIRRPAQNRIRF